MNATVGDYKLINFIRGKKEIMYYRYVVTKYMENMLEVMLKKKFPCYTYEICYILQFHRLYLDPEWSLGFKT